MVGKVNTFWELGWRCMPDMMLLFEQLERAIGSSKEGTVLESIYQRMPARNFSSHLLQRIPDRTAVIEVTRVLWSDWGQPDRVITTLRQIGKSPMFPAELLDA